MITLNQATNDVLRVTTAASADSVHVSVDYVDVTGDTPGTSHSVISSSPQTVCATPSSGLRQIDSIIIRNAHASAARTVTIDVYNGSVATTLYSATLAAGKTIVYTHGIGWPVSNAIALNDIGTAELTDGQIPIGQTGAVPLAKSISGDATLAKTGALSVASMLGGLFVPSGPSVVRTYSFPDASVPLAFMAVNAQSLGNGGSYTVTGTDCTIKATVTATAGQSATINLPPAASNSGKLVRIYLAATSGGTLTIDANGAETIDGALTNVLYTAGATVTLQCDGSGWHVLHADDYRTASQGSWTNMSNTHWVDVVSVSVPPGTWDLIGQINIYNNSATLTGGYQIAISAYSADTTTDHAFGSTQQYGTAPQSLWGSNNTMALRVSPTVATTYYLKVYSAFSSSTPQFTGGLVCKRAR